MNEHVSPWIPGYRPPPPRSREIVYPVRVERDPVDATRYRLIDAGDGAVHDEYGRLTPQVIVGRYTSYANRSDANAAAERLNGRATP